MGLTSISGFSLEDAWASQIRKGKGLTKGSSKSCQTFSGRRGLPGSGIEDHDEGSRLFTVGGFYKHFKSRDDFVAEEIGSALGVWKRQVDAALPGRRRQVRVASR